MAGPKQRRLKSLRSKTFSNLKCSRMNRQNIFSASVNLKKTLQCSFLFDVTVNFTYECPKFCLGMVSQKGTPRLFHVVETNSPCASTWIPSNLAWVHAFQDSEFVGLIEPVWISYFMVKKQMQSHGIKIWCCIEVDLFIFGDFLQDFIVMISVPRGSNVKWICCSASVRFFANLTYPYVIYIVTLAGSFRKLYHPFSNLDFWTLD